MELVNVTLRTDDFGCTLPNVVSLNDGRSYKIKRILHTAQVLEENSKLTRYTILIQNTQTYIYHSKNDWFVCFN